MKKTDKRIWVYFNALSRTKCLDPLADLDFDTVYEPFIINRALSYHEDAVLPANIMNERSHIEPALQFHFLLNTLAPRKRFSEWLKTTVSEDERTVAEYYGCSIRHARTILALHTPDQMKILRRRIEKGGAAMKAGTRHVGTRDDRNDTALCGSGDSRVR